MYTILEECCFDRGLELGEVLPILCLSDDELRDVDAIEERLDTICELLGEELC